ncbi:hypothetical protein [Sphingomonas sp. OTU376]|uniref:hypothetical protein n=1 Tax=Sphingomonas sp. OTU376 TaxID=3043863 RepID=UPI00313B512D
MNDLHFEQPIALRDALVKRLRDIEEQMDQLHREAESIRDDLDVTERFLSVWRRTNNVQGPPQAPVSVPTRQYEIRSDVPLPKRRPKNPSREKVVNEALSLIERAGKPLSRQELYDRLKLAGVEVFGKDPQMVLSTMLWRSQDRIVRLGNFGYWPKEEPYQPANYIPEIDEFMGVATHEPDGELEDPEDEAEVASESGD